MAFGAPGKRELQGSGTNRADWSKNCYSGCLNLDPPCSFTEGLMVSIRWHLGSLKEMVVGGCWCLKVSEAFQHVG